VYSLVHGYHWDISLWFHKCPLITISALLVLLSRQFRSSALYMVLFISEPYHFELTHDFVYPFYSIDPREHHLHSCQSSFRSISLTLMGVVSIGVQHEKVLPHPEHPMKLLDKEDWVMDATWWESTTCTGRLRMKSCMRDQEAFLLLTVPIFSSLHDQCILHRFLCFPSFHKSWDEIFFKGECCNTLCYKNANHLH
jgi:hypothetical protein